MEPFKLTRLEMAKLMYSLKGQLDISPLAIVLKSADMTVDEAEHHIKIPEFIIRYERKKQKTEHGLSTNEIVELGNLCELTSLKSTAIQNWIKRDIKDLMGHPELGKKYSIDQAVILLIVRDLKSVYDFETIRPILKMIFNTITDRSDDIVSPLRFMKAMHAFLILCIRETILCAKRRRWKRSSIRRLTACGIITKSLQNLNGRKRGTSRRLPCFP